MGGSLNYAVPAPDDVPMGANYAVPAPDDPPAGYPIYERSGLGKFLHEAGQSGMFGSLGYAATRDVEQPKEQRVAKGFWQAAEAGYQGSASSLVTTGKRPDIVLNSEHAKWYEKLASMGAQVAGDFPFMVLGSVGAGAAASETGPVGVAVAGSAGALAVPTAIRTSLMEAYEKGEVSSLADFLLRTNVVMKATNVAAISGGLMGGAGAKVTQALTPLANEAVIAGTRSATGARLGVRLASEVTESVVQPISAALLEGRLPEPEEFLDAGVLVLGVRMARHAAGKMTKIYAKTGVPPTEVAAMAKTDPKIAEALKADDLEMPEPFQEMANQQAVADTMGDGSKVKLAEFLADPVGVIHPEKVPNHPNYRFYDSADEVKAVASAMTEVFKREIEDSRGSQSWGQLHDKALELLKERKINLADGTFEDLAAKAFAWEGLTRKAELELADAAREVRAAGASVSSEALARQMVAFENVSFLSKVDQGNGAEIARALNARKAAKELRQFGEQVSNWKGGDPQDLARMIGSFEDTHALRKFVSEAKKATTYDMIVEAWKAGLVSGPVTQVANVMGNTSFMAMRPAVDAVAAGFGMFSKSADRVRMVEPLARIYGDLHGVMDGLKVAKAAFLMDAPGGKAEHMQAIPGKTGYVVRTPFRALAAGDALFRVMTERGEAYSLASRQATIEGHNLATAEFRNRVAGLVNNPTEAMQKEITASGQRFTFNSKLGEKGRAVQQFVKSWHLQFAVPFISTPGNVFKEMARLTPAAPIVGEWRADFAAGGARAAKAMAEVALGTSLSALTMSLALAGHVSGAGDPDPNKRRIAQAAGWQPYSIKIDGTWHSYQRFQPVGTLLGLAADMAEVWEHLDDGESDAVPKILATAFANSVTNQTFLQGLSSVVEALAQPDRQGPRLIQNLVASAVPALIGQTAQMMDPYQRELSSIREAVQNRIPGLRENLMPSRDPFGEPIASPDRMGWISPITTKDRSTDKVRTEAARLGIGEGKAPKSISLPAGGLQDIGNVPLSPEQRDVFGDVAGHKAHEILTQLVNSPGWEHMPDDFQKKAYRLVFEKAHQAGKAAALTDEQRQVEIQRILSEVAERLKP